MKWNFIKNKKTGKMKPTNNNDKTRSIKILNR